MDSFQKIKQESQDMIIKQQAQIYDARTSKQSFQLIGEMMTRLEGMKKVYNAILEIEGKPAFK